jgi:hypothetical protein
MMLTAILAGGCVCPRHTAASHAESSTKPSIVREDIEWSRAWVPGINHTDKPHILLIGDSITKAYSSVVEKQFEGTAYVARLCTSKSLGDPAYLQEVELVLGNTSFQVIHFNNGMHGGGYSEEAYRRDYPRLIAILKKRAPEAKLICATTTAKRVSNRLDQFDVFNDRIKVRNAIAREAASRAGIPVNDLFALVENQSGFYSNDGTYANGNGVEAEGRQVAESIQAVLITKH